MRNRMYGGVRGRKTKVGRKLLRFPPTRFMPLIYHLDEKKRKPFDFRFTFTSLKKIKDQSS